MEEAGETDLCLDGLLDHELDRIQMEELNLLDSEDLGQMPYTGHDLSSNKSESATLLDGEDLGSANGSVRLTDQQMTNDALCNSQDDMFLSSGMHSKSQNHFFSCNSQNFPSVPERGQVNGFHSECMGEFFLGMESTENGYPLNDHGEDHGDSRICDDINEDSVRYSSGRKGGRRQRNRSVTKEKEDLKENSRKESRSHGGKHKQTRKRNHTDSKHRPKPGIQKHFEEFIQPCLPYFKIIVDVIVFLTVKCGEYVETGGKLMYSSCCHLQTSDLTCLKDSMQATSRWLSHHVKSGSDKLKQFCGASADLTFKFFKMMIALLFLVLMLFIGCLRLCWQYAKSGVSSLYGKVAASGDGTHATHFPGISFLHRVWTLFKETRTFVYVTGLLQRWRARFGSSESYRSSRESFSSPAGSSSAGRYQAGQEVERLLAMASIPEEDLDPFKVLGVEMTASDTELKKAYRQLAILVHPDKNWHPRAEEAFKVLRAAWDIVSSPEKRKEYEMKRTVESELSKSMNEFLIKLQDDLKEAMNTMMCNKCQGKHKRFEMDRNPLCARYCAECNKMHPVEEGDFWAESSMLGLKITYFAMMDGKVYDITEWAGCQRVGISPDTHRVPYHISFGNRNSGNGGRQRTPSEGSPSSPGDLQDLFNRIFQGSPGQAPNGGLFSPPPQGGTTNSANQPKPDSTQKGDSKMRRRKKVRRPFQR